MLTFSQEKKLQEQFGNYRIHAITEFVTDTTTDEAGKSAINFKAKVTIYREGIDGNYEYIVPQNIYGNNDKVIDYMATKPEYVNYKVVK